MLQQTTVVAVRPYFEDFLKRWPTVEKLAVAKIETVMAAWAGLGYYARAHNLHKCAGVITREHGEKFPQTEADLRKLPGIGPYTAGAMAAIAFGKRAVVVDGNVERVMARVFAVTAPLPKSKEKLRDLATELTPKARAGDYAQAVMDLGATVCTPKSPRCGRCPWAKNCAASCAQASQKLCPAKCPKPRGLYGPARRFGWSEGMDACCCAAVQPAVCLAG